MISHYLLQVSLNHVTLCIFEQGISSRSIVKNCLRKMDCTNKIELIQSVMHIWFHYEEMKQMCKKLILSKKQRVKLVLENKGGQISY